MNDPWLAGEQSHIIFKDICQVENDVSRINLMVQSSNKWNSELINKLVPRNIAEQIMSIYFPNSEDQIKDKITWLHHPNGSFSTKSFQKMKRSKQPSSSHYQARYS